MGEVEVIQPGMLSSVQDAGRRGYRHAGVPESGAFDDVALSVGNRLLGNVSSAAAVEMTMVGGEFRFTESTAVCMTGALGDGALVTDDGCEYPLEWNRPFVVPSDSRIRVGRFSNGARGYLCIAGGFSTRAILKSRSALVSLPDAGLGRRLQVGDCLEFDEHGARSSPTEILESFNVPAQLIDRPRSLRIVEGAHTEMFTNADRDALGDTSYSVSNQSNRAGIRLQGLRIMGDQPNRVASEGTLLGYVQVPASGEPIVLGVDGPVTGGYPVIACVIKADLAALAQVSIREQIRFRWVSRQDALDAYAELQSLIQTVQATRPVKLTGGKNNA
ncbi:MAG: biotin-dependent carboxyltransferase family protein [Phycisphaerales bacterium]|nr:biotin-dependent carboxyltransferase family protein [Phycisphaerales bacterium]